MGDQADKLRVQMQTGRPELVPGQPRVLATASGKGGVGKTNFCVNFALGLQRRGFQPVVIDADLGFADVEVLLGVRPRRTIVDVIEGTEIWDALEFSEHGLPFLSAGSGLLDLHDLTPWQMDRLLEQVSQLHERFDVVLLDCGAGMGANFGRMLAAVDDLVVVTTPEPTAIADAYALLKMLVVRGCLPETRLVINRVRNLAEGRETAEKLRLVADRFLDAKVDVLGFVLEDHTVARAVMEQRALLQAYPHSPAARCFDQLVHNYLRVETVQPSRGLGGFFERLLRRVRPAPREEAADSSGHTA